MFNAEVALPLLMLLQEALPVKASTEETTINNERSDKTVVKVGLAEDRRDDIVMVSSLLRSILKL